MYVIKYDKMSMIKLVNNIEKYPAIYNNKKHFSKEAVDKAWDKVAREVGEKESLCREKWHSIKSCYIRHLKFSALNSKRRAYYLAEHMDFIAPFVSDRIRKSIQHTTSNLRDLPAYLKEVLPSPGSTSSLLNLNVIRDPETLIKSEVVDIEELSESDWYSEVPDQPSSSNVAYKTLGLDNITSSVGKSQPNTSNVSYKALESGNSTSSGVRSQPSTSLSKEEMFFKQILTEVAKMSSHQKLKFKQDVLSFIEDILYASDEINVAE